MQNYRVRLQSEMSTSFIATKAANSVDLDIEKKSIHELEISADMKTPFNVGLIVGNSGSGKTTLARQVFGEAALKERLDMSKAVIDQFPSTMTYEEVSGILSSVGLTSVPCWIRPAYTLSNGQRARAEAALAMISTDDVVVIDEWTSVVDRTVGKIMSNCVQKFARKYNKKVVLLACHYDIIDWLQPDFVIDCTTQTYTDRRSLPRLREERIEFEIAECGRAAWKDFSKYHYLSEKLPGGTIHTFGLFIESKQIGFQCFANYVPGRFELWHFNRLVIHPDYCGLGLGQMFLDETCKLMKEKGKILGKFSSISVYKNCKRNPKWKLRDTGWQTIFSGSKTGRIAAARNKVRWWSFEFIG